ncbi:MAG: alpha/beta hydrolase-fold protein [Vicinamibacterales bacterium]
MTPNLRIGAGIATVALGAALAGIGLLARGQELPRPAAAAGQATLDARGGDQPAPPRFASAEVAPDRRITFRVFAPNARAVRLAAGDIPGMTAAVGAMTKAENGVWEVTVGPVPPGAYRYNFNIDGIATIDPRSSSISESNTNVWSLVVVPGNDLFDTKNVPHGAVAAVTYWSTALGAFRRMHVYTPPGYELDAGRYPVLYLLHGAGDNDHAWASVGRAGFILDNLIAAGKARPMVVVMPAGHTPRATGSVVGASATEDFVNDFVKDVMPYVESHYRVRTERAATAIAGLSMGGLQTLAVAVPRLGRFGYIGVFSSGLISAFPELARRGRGDEPSAARPSAGRATQGPPRQTAAEWEKANAATLDDASLKNGLELLWFATGKEDFLLTTTQATVELFRKHGFQPIFRQTAGGHTWINWRDYLAEFASQLFQKNRGARPEVDPGQQTTPQ